MSLTPDLAIADLDQYVSSLGYRLSGGARKIFEAVEYFVAEIDTTPLLEHYAIMLIEVSPRFREAVKQLSTDYDKSVRTLKHHAISSIFDPYGSEILPYSARECRKLVSRTRIIDLCLAIAQKYGRKEVFDMDVVQALFETHNESAPISENSLWTDKKLNTNYNGLAHFIGHYERCLDIPFELILKHLEIEVVPKSPVEQAPAVVRSGVLSLLQDYPDYQRNCFVIMSFSRTSVHEAIYKEIKTVLKEYGFMALRADTRSYSDDLLLNVQAYLYGCRFAIAVFERLISETINPNVSFEVGFLYGIGKPVCLLKEKTLKELHSDVVGRLYVQFDCQATGSTIRDAITAWLRDHNLI